MAAPDMKEFNRRMDGALEVLRKEFAGLRTGRASASLLEPVQVDAYGNRMPLVQVGTVNVPEPRLITVQVWDKSLVKSVESAIREAGLGLNPMSDGQLVRVPIPDLTQDRRNEIIKVAHKYAEQARISVRNVRRDAMDRLKKMEHDGDLSQDEHRDWNGKIQKLTDEHIKKVDDALASKENEVKQV